MNSTAQPRPLAATLVLPSFDAVYQENFAFVWRVLRALGVPEAAAEDAAQEVFVIVHRKLPELDAEGSVRSWLFAIAQNVARNARRSSRRKGTPAELDPELPSGDPDAGEQLESRRALETVFSILEELDEDQRVVLVLTEIEAMTAPEIAAALALNINTVYARQRRARARFHEAYARRTGARR